MRKRLGLIVIITGAVLILSALLLFLNNRREDEKAGEQSEKIVNELRLRIDQEAELSGEPSEPIMMVEGCGYIGFLTIPALGLDLPVMDDWDYQRLKQAPCRQFGSTATDDLVIAAHNYDHHFGRLKELKAGDEVQMTDGDGTVHTYVIFEVTTLKPTDVELVQNSEHDLVLYTCTYGGKNRVAAFCDRKEKEES